MAAEGVLLSQLAAVAARTQPSQIVGDDVVVTDLEHDSRLVTEGGAFIAVPGSTADGHGFAGRAISLGAAALIVERRLEIDVPQLVVADTRSLMADLAAEVHGHPATQLTTIGVTGTNGKTTVTHMLEAMAIAAGRKVGIVGTVGARIDGAPVPLEHTTPEAPHLQRLLRRMVDAGVEIAALEVSSHALALGRADAIQFDVAAFTNLSQDHLDFHGDMEEYFATKQRLFTPERAKRCVVVVDDPWGARIAEATELPCDRVGFDASNDIAASDITASSAGTNLTIVTAEESFRVRIQLAGRFNAANALVATACALRAGLTPADITDGLATMSAVPGRFELVDAGQPFTVVVDYAHTPDAVTTVIAGARPLTQGRVIALAGAGGDRDRSKRPLMGAALATADIAVVTSDNPRSEEPIEIVRQVAAGTPHEANVVVDVDRRQAIRRALALAAPGDFVLILGKGHETGQEIRGRKHPFDDRAVAREELMRLAEHGEKPGPLQWTLASVAESVRGAVTGDEKIEVNSVTTDSRLVQPGALFVALRGEHFDGHDFAGQAIRDGAAAALVEPGTGVEPRVEVGDSALALRDLAATRRAELTGRVIAVTGSTGKTSTKDLLAAALPGAVASPKSYNNEVGVPLTMLSVPDGTPHIVVEVGSRGRGHIAWLSPAVRPHVAIITNLGVVHMETFGSPEVLADAKWELAEALEPGGVAVVPVDDQRLHRSHAGTTLTFGTLPSADVSVSNIHVDEDGLPSFHVHTPAGNAQLQLPLAGAHQALNAAAAIGAGLAAGVDLESLVSGLRRARGSAWRMEIHRGRYTVVNDAYNANPDSVQAALETVAALPGRHVAILGRMAELGPLEAEEHRRMGAEAARLGYAAVITVGEDPGYAAGAPNLVVPAADPESAWDLLHEVLRQDDVVLVKASRASGLEVLAHRLVEEAQQ